jgi:hypothetical protein
MPIEIVILTALRGIVEVAGLMLLVRGALALAGPKVRQGNFIFDLLTIGTMPFIKLSRKLTPRLVPDRYVPAIAFVLLALLWIALGLARLSICSSRALQCA